jgi:hypothetical protein
MLKFDCWGKHTLKILFCNKKVMLDKKILILKKIPLNSTSEKYYKYIIMKTKFTVSELLRTKTLTEEEKIMREFTYGNYRISETSLLKILRSERGRELFFTYPNVFIDKTEFTIGEHSADGREFPESVGLKIAKIPYGPSILREFLHYNQYQGDHAYRWQFSPALFEVMAQEDFPGEENLFDVEK